MEYGAALALALSGDSARAQQLANDLEQRFPEDTSVRFSYLPTVRAQLALNHGDPAKAIDLLQVANSRQAGVLTTAARRVPVTLAGVEKSPCNENCTYATMSTYYGAT